MNQKGGLILAQAGNMLTEALEAGLLREQEKAKTTPSSCVSCNKPTRSHKFGPLTMCHLCYVKLTPYQLAELDTIVKQFKLEETAKGIRMLFTTMTSYKQLNVLYCDKHSHYMNETQDICPDCQIEAETEAQAYQDAAAAQAEHEAACREQAEFEDQQAADEAYYHNQGGPDG